MADYAGNIREYEATCILQEKKDNADMVTRIGAGMALVLLFGAIIAGGVIVYKHLPEEYKTPAIVLASVVLSPVAVAILAAPFVCLAKAIKNRQQEEPLSSLIDEITSERSYQDYTTNTR